MATATIQIEVKNLDAFYKTLCHDDNVTDFDVITEKDNQYKAYIIVSNEIREEASFDNYEEAKEWCDMVYTTIEEYEDNNRIQYIGYVLIGGEIHDSAEFDTKEKAEKWCNAITTEIEKVSEE